MNEREMYQEALNGGVYDVTAQIPKEWMEEELAELMYTWSVFKDSDKLNGALDRHIKQMCYRIADHNKKLKGLSGDYVDEEGNWLEECDRYYDEKKDRQAEGM
jgi:1,2-phenylacetyl-CoA epoxidase catalytic subunit